MKLNSEYINPEIGKRIRECREELTYRRYQSGRGPVTQEALAEEAECSANQISYLERGHRKLSLELARRLAVIFNVRAEYLLCEDDYKTDEELWDKRRKLFEIKENISLQLLRLAGYEPICDFVKNWKDLNLDKKIYGPFKEDDTAAKHIPSYLDNDIEWATEISTPNGKHFYCDGVDFQLLSYELIEYINFRMAQLESKYAWQYDDGKITPKSPGSEYNFYQKVDAQENPNFLANSIWVTHDDDSFPQIEMKKHD